MFDVSSFRRQFAFFHHHPDWVYLDNAATMQKPDAVTEAVSRFYQQDNSNVHRGAHQLSQQATAQFEQARQTIAHYIKAQYVHEVIFTSGATAGLNQLAFGLMHTVLKPGDRILLTQLEHHANIVPWQLHCQRYGVIIDVVPLTADRQLDLNAYQQLLALKPKLVSFSHISNVLGHIQPVQQMVALAKAAGAITVVDGAQGVVYQQPDMRQLDCDFYVFSGHKLYGPTGVGVLYGKTQWLEQLTPLCGGGEMIDSVSFVNTTFNNLPFRLEAGTPNIAGVIGLAAAINWLQQYNNKLIIEHKSLLLNAFFQGARQIKGVAILSMPVHNAGIVALNVDGEHPSDVADILNQQQVAVRAGQHCAMPLFDYLALNGAVRVAFAAYNTLDDVNQCLLALEQAVEILTA
ncbi:aminotransferase class V-fold PLP-dependent enzyme [Rheinheimera nanhaiensis]|uniref:cysteine desulfurase n=1 Tax=Rheinheimera nanhaiensis E407-8 TaxID=562729 RepID=I1E0Z6_9GAMM|nr:cysteine desulfurase [Rheinheimera nanhaiensis]GAB59974.1 probable cysteine desulfurase [Rheinheimera nanhaiensis E407-8]